MGRAGGMKEVKVLWATPKAERSCPQKKTCPWKPEPWEGLPGTNLVAASCTSSEEAIPLKGASRIPSFQQPPLSLKEM